jgi:hypothetical protein
LQEAALKIEKGKLLKLRVYLESKTEEESFEDLAKFMEL